MAVLNGKKHTAMWGGIDVKTRSALQDAVIRFDLVNTAPTTTTGHRYLYTNSSSQLVYDNGTSTVIVGAAGGAATTWEALFTNDTTLAMTATGMTMSQSGNAMVLTLTKTGTGAGAVLTTNNAGTGSDLALVKTEASSTGIVMNTFHNSATAADSDVIFEHLVRGTDDAGTPASVSYGRIRFLADDVSASSEDATYQLALMVAGTSRTCLDITGSSFMIGDGNSAATIDTSGAFDLVLQTNAGTDSGTITITDAANGNIQIAPNGTGILDLNSGFDIDAGSTETCTITVVGTTGNGLAIDSSTITSGNVVYINHSVSGTLNGGNLLSLAVDGAAVATWGESGNMTLAGSAVGTAVVTLTAGNLVLSDGNVGITSTGTTDIVAITANSLLANNALIVAGSGTFTGTGTSSFVAITPTGATTGTGLYIALAAATTLSYALDITTSTTTGTAARLTNSGILTGVGAALSIIADAATTAGNSAGEGVVNISADGLTTGAALNVESLSNELMTSGHLADFAHSAVGTTIAAKTGSVVRVTSSMTESGTSTQDYDVMALTRTSVHDTAGTLTAQGSVLRLEVVSTQTGATLTDTVAGLEIVMGAVSGGDAITITHSGTTTGQALVIAASQTTVDGVLNLTGNSVDSGRFIVADVNALTTGLGLEVTHTTSVITTGSVVRITSTGVDTGTGQGTLLDLVSSGATAARVVGLVADALTTGTGVHASFDGLTSGFGLNITHTTSVIEAGGSLMQLQSTGIDTSTTTGCVLNLIGSGSTAGTQVLETYAALTTGTAHRIVANALTSGIMLDLENSDAGFSGNYIRCYDGAAVDFSVGEDGRVVLTGANGITAISVTNGDITLANGAVASAREQVTLGAAATAIAVDSNVVEVTGDAGGNTVTTITGGVAGQILVLLFVDALVTINDDNTHGADSVDLVGANTTFADDATLTLMYDGTSWYEITRSIND